MDEPEPITPSEKLQLFEAMLETLCNVNNWGLDYERDNVPKKNCRSAHLVDDRPRQFSHASIKMSDELLVYALEIGLKDKETLSTLLYRSQSSEPLSAQILNELNMFEPDITFVNDAIENNLDSDKRVLTVVSLFGVLAVVIACIGVFGLASFTIHQKRREIALRKVLGATPISITNLVAKEFILLVLISALLAWPITYFMMNQWLQQFNTQIEQSLWMYFGAASLVIFITWITVTCITFIAASQRPFKVLGAE